MAAPTIIIFEAERVILPWVQVPGPIVLMPRPIPMPAGNPATLYIEEAEGVLFTACGVCKHTVDLRYF